MSTQAVVPSASVFFNFADSARAAGEPVAKVTSAPKQEFSDEIKAILLKPLPTAALTAAPRGLTSIKAIFVAERLNDAFGQGRWYLTSTLVERLGKDVVTHSVLHLTDYPWFYAEAFGGNGNVDLGDAYKGACTDGLTKICAQQLGIGIDVYKGQGNAAAAEDEKKTAVQNEADAKAAKQKAAKEEIDNARAIVANPPDCSDCKTPIKTWTHPTNSKVYDAADLIKNSEKKYGPGVHLCADCQAVRAAALKAQSKVSARTQ
jgi:hypothetical protein